MGRKSFEVMAPYWPTATGPFAAPMNEIPKAFFTKKGFAGILPSAEQSPAAASWAEAQVFDGDLAIPLYLKLVDVKAFPGGVIAQTYRI